MTYDTLSMCQWALISKIEFFDAYDDIIRANKCLFGNQCVVEFVVL